MAQMPARLAQLQEWQHPDSRAPPVAVGIYALQGEPDRVSFSSALRRCVGDQTRQPFSWLKMGADLKAPNVVSTQRGMEQGCH